MAEKWIEDQVQAIREATKSASTSKEAAKAFLKAAGILQTPDKKKSDDSSNKLRK